MNIALKHLLAGILCALAPALANAAEEVRSTLALRRAHSHNDYERPRPLQDALDLGFGSVEADIWLVDGELLVAHDRKDAKPGRTMQALYLDPLRARARQHGGRIYPGGPPLILLIDVKSEAEATYAALHPVLGQYRDLLSSFSETETRERAITAIISGNRARATMEAQSLRYAALDGRLPDLNGTASKHLIPLVSDNWNNHFQWRGVGAFTAEERTKLRSLAAKARSQGCKLRFWATPDREEAWRELHEAGVDLINTDDLKGLNRFLLTAERPSAQRQ